MTDHPTLFAEPTWVDAWALGDRLTYVHHDDCWGHVAAKDARSITVAWHDHPRWGSFTTVCYSDMGLVRA